MRYRSGRPEPRSATAVSGRHAFPVMVGEGAEGQHAPALLESSGVGVMETDLVLHVRDAVPVRTDRKHFRGLDQVVRMDDAKGDARAPPDPRASSRTARPAIGVF